MDMPRKSLPLWLERYRNKLASRCGKPVEMIETHISWVMLAGDFAYKLKKPVTFPFLDYGSVARRHFFCKEELRLNRRFSPALYIDVEALPGSEEWAVRMHRFDEASRLDHVCARGALSPEHITQLARTIDRFQTSAPLLPASADWARPEALIQQCLDNFSALGSFVPEESILLSRLKEWTEETYGRQRERILMRRQNGRVREGHGDLHLANLVLLKGEIVPFDCIEFSEALRWIDVASEVAFTYVDLLAHQRPDLAGWFINEWLAFSGDYDAMFVLRFYALYRAMVRARVAAILGKKDEALIYLKLGAQLIEPDQLKLTITFGPSGSGKSFASRHLIFNNRSASLIRVRSDVERRRLLGGRADEGGHSPVNGGIFDSKSNSLTYAYLANRSDDLLKANWSVVVDATFLERKRRAVFQALADHRQATFSILACDAPLETLRSRIQSRRGDASEATVDVLEEQLSKMERLESIELPYVLRSQR